MNRSELRNATPSEQQDIIAPGLISMSMHFKALNRQRIATLTAGFLSIAVLALVCAAFLHLSTAPSFLLQLPIIAIFSFSLFRTEQGMNTMEYMMSKVEEGQFLVKEIPTKFEDVYVLVAYVRHPRIPRLVVQAFSGAFLDEENDPSGEKHRAVEDICRKNLVGEIEVLDPEEGD